MVVFLQQTETENTVQGNVISAVVLIVRKNVNRSMSNSFLKYVSAVAVIKSMQKNGILTASEYCILLKEFIKKYIPFAICLMPDVKLDIYRRKSVHSNGKNL